MGKLKPMLAADAPEDIRFPVLVSAKLDGIRATVQGGQLLSRTLKPIPNKHLQSLDWGWAECLDGELIVGPPGALDVYRTTVSGVMSHEGVPEYTFFIFDMFPVDTNTPYRKRYDALCAYVGNIPVDRVVVLPQLLVKNMEELLEFEKEVLASGFEGIILRDIESPYKHGRSTAKQGYLLKLKRFKDAEARIVDFEPLLHNGNEAKKNELGHTERSTAKENLVPMDTLGAFIVEDLETGVSFKIGTGFTQGQRKRYWDARENLVGSLAKYKYFDVGVKEKPRHPVFLAFRDEMDVGEA
jgi:DNA ligase-1